MFPRLLSGLVAASLIAASGSALLAQSRIPRTADGRPDLQGFWQVQGRPDRGLEAGFVTGGKIPYLPAAAAKRATLVKERATADPFEHCYIPGVPRVMSVERPFQILQTGDHLAMLFEWTLNYRLIFTDGGDHPTPFTPFMGYATGKWEGDTFVAVVTNLNDRTWLDQTGTHHSDALRVVERYTLTGRDTIRYEATLEDPNVFEKPWTVRLTFARKRGLDRIAEFHCQAEKEEKNGDFEREERTWYPGPKAAPGTFAFAPPVEQPRPSTAPASVRRTADGKPDLNGAWESDHGGANFGLQAHPREGLMPPGRGIVIAPPD
ncbi:MAG: hypothetical protein AB7P67_09620, partial [Vicinamibacterales bacterium]